MILVTGASGHLGLAVSKRLVQLNVCARLFIRDRRKLDRAAEIDKSFSSLQHCDVLEGDIRDGAAVERALKGVSRVIHCCHSHEYWKGSAYLLDVNVGGTDLLAAKLRHTNDIERVVFVGSYSAHDAIPGVVTMQQAMRMSPRECSQKSKVLAGDLLRKAAVAGGYELVVVSPSYLIGPYQLDPTYWGALFHFVLMHPLRWAPPHGFNVVDVRDVAELVVQQATQGGEGSTRILASGENVQFRDLFSRMNAAAGHTNEVGVVPVAVIRILPRLRYFGDFGRQYYQQDHYVRTAGITERKYSCEESVVAAVGWARRGPLFRNRWQFVRWLAGRYL